MVHQPVPTPSPVAAPDACVRGWRAAWPIGLAAVLIALVAVGGSLVCFEGDVLRFVRFGSERSPGYDGIFYYIIARDWMRATPHLDGPSLRYMRILYPLLARVLSLGQPALLPWALVLLNVLAFGAGALLMAYLAACVGGRAWYGLVYALWIGHLVPLVMDLSELVCTAFGLAAVVAYLHRRPAPVILLLTASVLSKEMGVVFVGGLALHAALGRRQLKLAALLAASPSLTLLGWVLALRAWLGDVPTQYVAAEITLPLVGFVRMARAALIIRDPAPFLYTAIWLALPAGLLLVAALASVARTRALSLSAALLLAAIGWVLIMPFWTWIHAIAAWRVGSALVVWGLIFLAEHHRRLVPYAVALWAPTVLWLPSIIVQM